MLCKSRYVVPAALLAAVWIATPVLSVFHFALEQHAYCEQHGTVEEIADTPNAPAVHAGDSVATLLPRGGSDHPDSDHQACAFGELATRDDLCVTPSSDGNLAPAAQTLRFVPVDSCAGSPIAVLSFAPKNSPPLVA